MATPYSTGPALIFVGVPASTVAALTAAAAGSNPISAAVGAVVGSAAGAGNAATTAAARLALLLALKPQYLGTCEARPVIRTRRHYGEVRNDQAGPRLAFDRIRAGVDAIVSVTLTRWNDPVWRQAASMSSGSSVEGVESRDDRGSLMATEGLTYPLYVVFPFYVSHPVFRAQGMVPGYRFFAAQLEGDADLEPGTDANKQHGTFYCQSVYDPVSGGFGCFDHTIPTGLNVPPN